MNGKFQSEIRDSQIRKLAIKVSERNYGNYLNTMHLKKIRAFNDEKINFNFPVTAIIGTNGGGKSTILGSAAIAYKSVRPALFFPKSSIGDDSMENWSIEYNITDKDKNDKQLISRSARFKRSKWVRDDLVDRKVLYFGINRTVPAGERSEFKKLATVKYLYSGNMDGLSEEVIAQAERILGKDVSGFSVARITNSQLFYVGGNGQFTYSEFHFGAGESSILRIVSQIETAGKNSLVLIEELENGLHPVATRRMVEYLIDVADRKSIQVIFTTHSEDALLPLPSEAIWSSIDGRVKNGRVSIEALRAITGRIDQKIAIFVEDSFAKEWVSIMIRHTMPERFAEIGIYDVKGDGRAYSVHMGHRDNPAFRGKLKSICILDGDSGKTENTEIGIIKLPGENPESEVYNFVLKNLHTLSMKVTVGLHVNAEKEREVKDFIIDLSKTNRDPHVIFNQLGQKAWLTSETIVIPAFINLWIEAHRVEVDRMMNFIRNNIDSDT